MTAAQQYCTSVLSARMGHREILAASLRKLLFLFLSRILGLQHPTGEYKHSIKAASMVTAGGDDSVVGTRVEDAQVCHFSHQLMLPCKSTEPFLTDNLCTQRPRMFFSVDMLCDL